MSADLDKFGDRLRARLTGFCGFLRDRGYFVGVGAEVDFARATNAIDVLDRCGFRAVCGATLAKSPEDLRFVNAAFDRYWSAPDAALDIPWTVRGERHAGPAEAILLRLESPEGRRSGGQSAARGHPDRHLQRDRPELRPSAPTAPVSARSDRSAAAPVDSAARWPPSPADGGSRRTAGRST